MSGGFDVTGEDAADPGPGDGCAVVDDEAEGDAGGAGGRVCQGAGDVWAIAHGVGCFGEG